MPAAGALPQPALDGGKGQRSRSLALPPSPSTDCRAAGCQLACTSPAYWSLPRA